MNTLEPQPTPVKAMTELRPASLFTRILSSFAPKRLEVEVHTAINSDGTVEVHPIFTIDGQVVPASEVGETPQQKILGFTVQADSKAISIKKETGGKALRVAKRHAGPYIEDLRRRGVCLQSTDGKSSPRVIPVKPEVTLTLTNDDTLSVSSQLTTSQGVIIEKPTDLDSLRNDAGWFAVGEDLFQADLTNSSLDDIVLTNPESRVLTGQEVPAFLQQLDAHAASFGSIEKDSRLSTLSIYGERHQNRLTIRGDGNSIRLEPELVFLGKDGKSCQLKPEVAAQAVNEGRKFVRRPEGWVQVRPEVMNAHELAKSELSRRLGSFDEIVGSDIPRKLAALRAPQNASSAWSVYFAEEVKNSHRLVDTPADARFSLKIVESDGQALLELDPRYNHERFHLSHREVSQTLAKGDEWIRRENAWIKVDRKRHSQVSKTISSLGLEQTADGVRFPAVRRGEVVEAFSRLGSIEHSAAYADFLAKLTDFERIEETSLPLSIRPNISLRPYQKHGYNWLAFLRKFGLNGILADDMGLGKTLQTLAVIRMTQEQTGGRYPSLIICPTSLVANWTAEAEKFFTGFHAVKYTGLKRDRVLRSMSFDTPVGESPTNQQNLLVVTSYGVVMRDQKQLSRIPWLYVILDEAHQIRNRTTKTTKSVKTVNGQHKLALTGTPIQNSLDDLWSLFDFTMPGYLGPYSKFHDQYSRSTKTNPGLMKDEKDGLKQRVHPFILRRLKENVAKDLPDKVVVEQKIELTPDQVDLYKAAIESAEFKKLQQSIETNGTKNSTVQILEIYSRLRSICNHPALASTATSKDIDEKRSGKLLALRERMAEVQEGEHRVLIFCQSTQMLDIIQQCFHKWRIKLLRLDGNTTPSARQELANRFNADKSITAFLISTKAGGTGLNLTGADTVIFYDHDWNPANDRQAQDRAYRIGQTRKVTVYKLVSQGTIEEKIIERQERKQSVADRIIGVDEGGYKELTKEQLLDLFAFRG